MLSLLFFFATAFSGYEECFERNLFFYKLYLHNDEPLTHLGYLHLKSLKYLIDLRIGGYSATNQDCTDIFELIDRDTYLYDEFYKKYSPESIIDHNGSAYKEIVNFLKNPVN